MGIKRKKAEKPRESYPQGVGAVFRSYPQPLQNKMQVLLQELSTAKVFLGILWIVGVETVGKLGRKSRPKTTEITPNGEEKRHESRTKGRAVFRLAEGQILFCRSPAGAARSDLGHRHQNPPSGRFIIMNGGNHRSPAVMLREQSEPKHLFPAITDCEGQDSSLRSE